MVQGRDGIPQGLRDYYRRYWQQMRMVHADKFDELCEPVVCVLAAAGESLPISKIAELAGLSQAQVRGLLRRQWLEFMHWDVGEGGRKYYRIYHKAYRDFLAEEVDVGLKKYHKRISDSILRKAKHGKKRSR